MFGGDKTVRYNEQQNKRIQKAVEAHERQQPYFRPQAIKPRFSGGRAAESLVKFQLEEDMTMSIGHAEARLLKLASAASNTFIVDDDKDPIEVYDWFKRNSDYPEVDSPGMWAGKAGYRGWAVKRKGATPWLDENGTGGTDDDESRDKYDIVWMEQIAERIMFTVPEGNRLDSSSGTTVLSVQVIRYDGQGIHPTATFESDGEELTVYVPFFFNDICQYAYGFAEYDYSEGKYYVVECTRVVQFAKAKITENMCGNESTIPISNFEIISHGDFVLSPEVAPTIASNPYAHAGPDNSAILLMRYSLAGVGTGEPQPYVWHIIDIAKRETNFIFDVKYGYESATNGIYYKERTARMEWCDPSTEPEWQLLVSAGNCDGTED